MLSRTPTKAEKEWMQEMSQLGCIVCIRLKFIAPWTVPEEYTAVHHIDGSTKPGAHFLTIPLCAPHHQTGKNARHVNKTRFEHECGDESMLLELARDYVEQKKGPAGVPSLPVG